MCYNIFLLQLKFHSLNCYVVFFLGQFLQEYNLAILMRIWNTCKILFCDPVSVNIDVFKAFLFMSLDLVLLIYLGFCIDRSFRRLWKFINLVLLFCNVGLIHLLGIVLAASISLLMVQSHDHSWTTHHMYKWFRLEWFCTHYSKSVLLQHIYSCSSVQCLLFWFFLLMYIEDIKILMIQYDER